MRIFSLLFFVSVGLGFAQSALADSVFTVPSLTGPIVDSGHLLAGNTESQLDDFLRALNDHGKVQLQVLTVESLNGVDIAEATIKVFDKRECWRGQNRQRRLVDDFKTRTQDRIEVVSLEGDLPDVYCKRIIEDDMAPYFRNGQSDNGILAGVSRIVEHVDSRFFESETIH